MKNFKISNADLADHLKQMLISIFCAMSCSRRRSHFENMPMQYTELFEVVINANFQQKNVDSFLIFSQNIDCGYTLEPHWQGGSNEYPKSMYLSKNKKNRYSSHSVYPSFTIYM